MRLKSSNVFRPAVESAESRVLATAGLAAPAAHPAEVHASTAPKAQAWVEIVNRTDHALTFQLSANAGSTFHEYRLRAHTSGYYHADHAASTILIKIPGAPVAALAASATRGGAEAYSIHRDASITPGVDLSGGGLGGSVAPKQAMVTFFIINQTSSSRGSGGVPVLIQFSVDGGRTFPLHDTVPYVNGLTPRKETIYYGNQGILYRLPANPSIQPTQLTTFGQYYLFSTTGFQPYLSPSS